MSRALPHNGFRHVTRGSRSSTVEPRLTLDLPGEHPQPPRKPRPPHPPPLLLQPPRHRRKKPHVPRDPVQVPPHRDEEHPRPIVLNTRLQPRPQPLPITIREQITPQTTPHQQETNPQKTRQTTKQPQITLILYEGGGGGHASESEQSVPNRKEPGNPPDHDRIIPKGAIIHTINHPDEQRPLRAKTAPERQRKETAPPQNSPSKGVGKISGGPGGI